GKINKDTFLFLPLVAVSEELVWRYSVPFLIMNFYESLTLSIFISSIGFLILHLPLGGDEVYTLYDNIYNRCDYIVYYIWYISCHRLPYIPQFNYKFLLSKKDSVGSFTKDNSFRDRMVVFSVIFV